MKTSISITEGIKIKWKGIFNFNDFYKQYKKWLEFQGYGDEKSTFHETQYAERIKGESKQIEAKWIAQRNRGDYFAYKITVKFIVVGLQDIQIDVGGKQ